MFKLFALALIFTSANAAWSGCNLPGVLSPDQIVSTHCPDDRCVVRSGEHFYANAFFTPVKVHQVLAVTATAFLGPIGIPVRIFFNVIDCILIIEIYSITGSHAEST